MDKCLNCKFYRKQNEEGGNCLRYPPQIFVVDVPRDHDRVGFRFPEINFDDVCGEWEQA